MTPQQLTKPGRRDLTINHNAPHSEHPNKNDFSSRLSCRFVSDDLKGCYRIRLSLSRARWPNLPATI